MTRTRSMKRTVSANQRRMMSVLSQQNCLNLTPASNATEKTLDKKMSTVNLMFLEDVLEDIESNAKKMHQDINKNIHNLKNIQLEKEKEKEKEMVASSEDDLDSENFSDDAEEIDSNIYDFGADVQLKSADSFDSVADEDGIANAQRLSLEEKKKTVPRKMQRLDSGKSVSAKSDADVNAQPGGPFKAHSFFVKKKTKACNKAVRLALLEAGPFRQLLKEGVKVIVHFQRKGETRITRVQRIMIWLDDDEVEQQGGDSNVQDREYFDADSSEEEVDFDDDGQDDKLNLFGFFKLDQNGILESSTNLSDINEITTVYMGANTSVFRRSLDHLHGEHKSYDRSEHSNRCFSLMGCKSPFDDRCCLDVEILPRDKQKPEVNIIIFTYSPTLLIVNIGI
jgi:phage terminase small subunit